MEHRVCQGTTWDTWPDALRPTCVCSAGLPEGHSDVGLGNRHDQDLRGTTGQNRHLLAARWQRPVGEREAAQRVVQPVLGHPLQHRAPHRFAHGHVGPAMVRQRLQACQCHSEFTPKPYNPVL